MRSWGHASLYPGSRVNGASDGFGFLAVRIRLFRMLIRRSARFEPQRRREDLGAHHFPCMRTHLVFPQELGARPSDRGVVVSWERLHLNAAPGELQCGGPTRREVPVPASPGAEPRTHQDLVVGYDYPDHYRGLRVLPGPDPQFSDIAQFPQRVRIEICHAVLSRAPRWPVPDRRRNRPTSSSARRSRLAPIIGMNL